LTPQLVPDSVFHIRVRSDAIGGSNPFEWKQITTEDVFAGKSIVLFAVPGAFTPTCSDNHLPAYEERFEEFRAAGVDDVICLAVNDAFVMFQWAKSRNIEKVRMLPDGNGDFTRKMGMLVQRATNGMGLRSWRYSMYVKNKEILTLFVEPGYQDNPEGVPLKMSDAGTMLAYLRAG
jgi:thioredoxin-dependent peroxiredoxin